MSPRTLVCECGTCSTCKRRAYMRDWSHKHAEETRTRAKNYRLANLEVVRAKDRARGFREHDPEKIAARNATRILRKDPHDCERCGAPNAHAHHDDYAKPLDVRWLCRACHGIEHRRF